MHGEAGSSRMREGGREGERVRERERWEGREERERGLAKLFLFVFVGCSSSIYYDSKQQIQTDTDRHTY